MLNVLIVDDSVVFRMAISEALSDVENVNICATASNGKIAIEYFEKNKHPDIVILDMEMPVMNGLDTIKEIRKITKRSIIICFSSMTLKGAELTISALSHGANDFVTKQETSGTKNINDSLKMIKSLLVPKIKAFSNVLSRSRLDAGAVNTASSNQVQAIKKNTMSTKPQMIQIASSTGGPEALNAIFSRIKHRPTIPLLLVQHMPPLFTNKLAQMLDSASSYISFKEAEDGEVVQPGYCYVAPGDFHMILNSNNTISLTQTEKVSFVRPSATVTFNSVAQNFDNRVMTFILTGMGDDGAAGLDSFIRRGDPVYVQDESTSVVWGMPGAAKRSFSTIVELNLEQIADVLNDVFENSK